MTSLATELTITGLYIYPLKSARGIAVQSFHTDRMGPSLDRRWMLVDPQGKFITQRQQARMALIDVALNEEQLICHAPAMGPLHIDRTDPSAEENATMVQIWKDHCEAMDCGEEAAAWFSDYLKTPCRLVKMPDNSYRYVDKHYSSGQETVAFSDGFPILLISQASLDDLNNRLEQALPMLRFRPNMVVSGCEPYAEDSWQQLQPKEGGKPLQVVKSCSRCAIPSIDIDTGERDNSTLRALRYRRKDGVIYFGQNLLCEPGEFYQLGQALRINQ